MREILTLAGWYEVEEGAMPVNMEGFDLREIVLRLMSFDPENFGHTDMELELYTGFDGIYENVTDQVYTMVAEEERSRVT
jgi:hypothetical protein